MNRIQSRDYSSKQAGRQAGWQQEFLASAVLIIIFNLLLESQLLAFHQSKLLITFTGFTCFLLLRAYYCISTESTQVNNYEKAINKITFLHFSCSHLDDKNEVDEALETLRRNIVSDFI